MSDDDLDGWALPAFDATKALEQLRRSLRDLKLAERGTGFELRGKRVLELKADGATLQARIARRLMLTPEWDTMAVKTAADQRKLLDEIKKRLDRWEREE